MLADLIAVVEKNGGLMELGKLLSTFYQTGEYKQLFTVWLAATEPKYRRKIMEVLACLLINERLIAKAMERQEEKKRGR